MTQLAVLGGDPVRRRPLISWPRSSDAAREAINDVLESGAWCRRDGEASYGLRAEEWLTELHNAAGAVMVTNGTHALEVAYQGLDLHSGQEVLVPAITFIATATAVSRCGAEPIPVDVLPDSLCMDPEDAARKINERTRMIVPVHLGGCPADMTAIMELANKNNLLVLEDCAQSLGAQWMDQTVGSFGNLSTFSFQSGKIITAGEGGAIVVPRDQQLLDRIRMLSDHGVRRGQLWYEHDLIGSNFRMTEFQACLIVSQLPTLAEFTDIRRASSLRLIKSLGELGVQCRTGHNDPRVTHHVWSSLFMELPEIVTESFDSRLVAGILKSEGIPVQPLYVPWYTTKAFGNVPESSCPVAEKAAAQTVFAHFSFLLAGDDALADLENAMAKVIKWCETSSATDKKTVQEKLLPNTYAAHN
jgi:dTDP-4-amino-4,6-dideoxygalactose transaminase